MARDVELNAEIARVASKFLAQNFPIVAAGEPLPKKVLKARWRQMLPLGWTHILNDGPNEFSGASQIETLFRTWGAHPAPGPAIDMFVALPTLYRQIPQEGRADLQPYIDGEKLLSLARFSEVDSCVCPDPFAGAVVTDGHLSGEKTLVNCSEIADAFLVTAQMEGKPVIALVEAAGNIEKTPLQGPDRSSHLSLVRFRDCAIVGAWSDEQGMIDTAIERLARLAIVAELAGMSEVGQRLAVDYAKVRQQFGRLIGSFQAIKHLLADGQMHVHSLSCVSNRLAEDLEAGSGLPGDAMRALCVASRFSQVVFDNSLQVHGGIGFTLEYTLSWYYNRAAGHWGAWGDPGGLAMQLGRQQLGVAI